MAFTKTTYKQVQQNDEDAGDSPVIVARPMEVADNENEAALTTNNGHTEIPAACWNMTRCAGCVGAMVGCCTTGSFCLSVICASGCMYCAKTQENMGGDIARACGGIGVQANVMIRDLNDEHKLLEKSKQLGTYTIVQVKQLNEDYDISQKTKDCVVSTGKAVATFTRENNLVERTAQALRNVLSVIAKEVTSSSDNNSVVPGPEVFSGPKIYASSDNEQAFASDGLEIK